MMRFEDHTSTIPWLIAICLGLAGCAPSIAPLRARLDAAEYNAAVEETGGDAALQIELAALLLERAAADGLRTPEQLDGLIAAGSSGKRAPQRLAENGPEAVAREADVILDARRPPDGDDLAVFLGHESSDVRARAARVWNSELDKETLADLLMDTEPRVRIAAVSGLCRLAADDGTEQLIREALGRDPAPRVRARAVRCPEGLGSEKLLTLKEALGDENLGVRLGAIEGLAATGDPAALEIVKALARGPLDTEAVVAAAELCRAGVPVGRERLDAALSDERPSLRKAALLRLERTGIEERDTLLAGLLDDESPAVVLLAATLLANREEIDPKVFDALKKLVEDDGSRAVEARDQLAVLADAESVEVVRQLLAEAEEDDALAVLRRVRRATDLAPTFVTMMGDARLEVRLAAARAVIATVTP